MGRSSCKVSRLPKYEGKVTSALFRNRNCFIYKIPEMIVHIFVANWIQLVPSISKGLLSTYRDVADHFILLYVEKNVDKAKYVELYSSFNFTNYIFCDSYVQFIKFLFRHRKDAILFHFGRYHWFVGSIFLGCSNINWVCWGSGAMVRPSLKSHVIAPLKKFIYRRFNTIITLMEPDRLSIIKYFGVNSENVRTIPYSSVLEEKETPKDVLCKKLMMANENRAKSVVLLGNNPTCMSSYITMLPYLKKYRGKIEVQCMLNYDLSKNSSYERLVSLGKSLFGDDFKCNEEFHEGYENYVNYMNTCDIYICSVTKQTGLGAIGTCLRLGKKVYIAGKNLDWIKEEYNPIVFSADSLMDNLSMEVFLKPLTQEEKEFNYHCMIGKYLERIKKWQTYYKEIDSKCHLN